MHIAIRLCDRPIRLFGDINDTLGQTFGFGVIAGPREAFYLRDTPQHISTVGAQLHTLAARAVFGMPACELANRHTRLDDVWGASVDVLRTQMVQAKGPEERLHVLEQALLSHVRPVCRVHPAIAHALQRFSGVAKVRDVAKETGYSQRRFIALFRDELGLTPKVFCRLLRFQKIVNQVAQHSASTWSALAYDAGYSDQAHFNREFREFTGITPGQYRFFANESPNHIPVLHL